MLSKELIDNIYLSVLEHSLEVNEYKKKQYNAVPVEHHEVLIEYLLYVIDEYRKEETSKQDFYKELSKITGVPYYKK